MFSALKKISGKIKVEENSTKLPKGFTLIELLIVITIIGILVALGLIAFPGAQRSARDARRLSDIRAIITALESYYNAYGEYPQTGWRWSNRGPCWINPSDSRKPPFCPDFMNPVPADPVNDNAPNNPLMYAYASDGSNRYQLDYTLERPNKNAIGELYENQPNINPRYRYFGGVR